MDMAGSKIVSNIKNKQKAFTQLTKCFCNLGLFQSPLQQKSHQNSNSNARIMYVMLQETLVSQTGCFIGLLAFKIRKMELNFIIK